MLHVPYFLLKCVAVKSRFYNIPAEGCQKPTKQQSGCGHMHPCCGKGAALANASASHLVEVHCVGHHILTRSATLRSLKSRCWRLSEGYARHRHEQRTDPMSLASLSDTPTHLRIILVLILLYAHCLRSCAVNKGH